MSLRVAATRVIADLVCQEELEVRRPEAVGRDLGAWLGELGRLPGGAELSDWLEAHRMVSEVFASDLGLEGVLEQHLGDVFSDAPPAQWARHPGLEAEIQASPSEPDAYLVYSDWLQEQGDPLGEFISLSVASTPGDIVAQENINCLLRKHEQHILGDFGEYAESALAFKWDYGFVSEVYVCEPLPEKTWSSLLGLRVLLGLQRLCLRIEDNPENLQALRTVAVHFPPTLNELILEVSSLELAQVQLPAAIDKLSIRGYGLHWPKSPPPLNSLALDLRVLELPQIAEPHCGVRELELVWNSPSVSFLSSVQLAKLECLRIDLDGKEVKLAGLLKLLGADTFPLLSHIELRGGAVSPDLLVKLAKAPAARRLQTLSLTELGLDDDAVAVLAERIDSFPLLESLDLSDNELTGKGLRLASAVAKTIRSRRQNRRGTSLRQRIRKFAGSRYAAAESLSDPKRWKRLGTTQKLHWGRYYGTEPYELYVRKDLSDYGCTCPSSAQPCKHVVALALIAAEIALPKEPCPSTTRSSRFLLEPPDRRL